LIQAQGEEQNTLFRAACEIRARRTGDWVTYSRKVFIPLTDLCRNACAYCGFAQRTRSPLARTLDSGEVLEIAATGRRAKCREALFSMGDKPERRFPSHRAWLCKHGYSSSVEYLAAMCRLVFEETGLLPHSNCGVLDREALGVLQQVNASLGMMLESTSGRLSNPGGAHHRCPDKVPGARFRVLKAAGELGVPFTTGLLIGIGESLEERIEALFAIRALHERYGHIQEVIIQNFRAKADTPFARRAEPEILDVARTAAVARLIFGHQINLQVPPNLSPGAHVLLLRSGINDWGGISPVTKDWINPEFVWPEVASLSASCGEAGLKLKERLPVYPEYFDRVAPLFRKQLSAWGQAA